MTPIRTQRITPDARQFSTPYGRRFSEQSRFDRSRTMRYLHECLSAISGDEIEEMLQYAAQTSTTMSALLTRARAPSRPLLERLRRLHAWAPRGMRATILTLLVELYSRQELVAAGFRFSNDQLRTARRLSENEELRERPPVRTPPSRQAVSEQTRDLIIELLNEYSRPTTQQTAAGEPVRMLERPKTFLYEQFRRRHPDVQLGRTSFYKYCPRYYRKASKLTDVCKVCEAGRRVVARLETLRARHPPAAQPDSVAAMIAELEQQVELYETHWRCNAQTRAHYQALMDAASEELAVVVIDFKENFRLPAAPVVTNQMYYD